MGLEEVVQARWPASRAFVQSTLDALTAHIAVLDQEGTIVAVNEAWRRFALANRLRMPAFSLGASYLAICDAAAERGAPFAAAAATGLRDVARGERPVFELEYPCHSPTEERWFVLRATRFESVGQIWVVVAHENVTERKKAEEQQQILLKELNHRIRNNIALVQTIAAQTVRSSASLEEFERAFGSRLDALVHTSTLVATRNWQAADLQELVEVALEPYRGDENNVRLSGESVTLHPQIALTLSMVLHELATNAAKYGALSTPEGRVEVTWAIEDESPAARLLVLTWAERGGPTVREPHKRGFGRLLIERSVAYELDGTARLEFPPTGVRCRIELPLGHHS